MAHKQNKQALKRRAEKRHQRAVTRKAKARRSAPHAGWAGLDGVIRMDSPLPKLSERIWEYAEPLLDGATDAEAQKRAAQLAIICWNVALLPEAKVEEFLRPTLQRLSGGDPRLESELSSIYAMMIERKHKYFEDDRRLVVHFSLSDTPEGVHLMVASTRAGDSQPPAQPT